jgi:hypothetical protein
MSHPQHYLAPYAPARPGSYSQANGAAPQSYSPRLHAQPYWTGQPPMAPRQWPWTQPGTPQPLFRVRLTKHTGLLMVFINETYTVTGTLEQCEAAIRQAQLHNMLAGWWSITSVLVMNWAALFENLSARKALRRQANQHTPAPRGVPR